MPSKQDRRATPRRTRGLEGDEDALHDFNGRVLAGTGARFGRNSAQYEAVGGVRTDDRKSPSRKAGPKPPSKS